MVRSRKCILFFALLLPLNLLAQNVSNVVAQQKGEKIEVSYSLDKEANIYLSATVDGRYLFCKTTSGDVGDNIPAGRHSITWDVLADVDELIGEVVFEVHASTATHTIQQAREKQQKQAAREERMKHIFPLAGFDINGGFYGIGGSVYWPWVINRPSRVGSYFSYVYHSKEWNTSNDVTSHNLCLGMTVTVSDHVALFAAPGLAVVKNKYEYTTTTRSASGSSDYKTTNYGYSTDCRWAVEGGVSFKLLCFTFSVKYAYPSYVGFGIGLDFGILN